MAELRAIEPARVAGRLGSDLLEGARFAVDADKPIVAYMLIALHEDGTISRSGGTSFNDNSGAMNSMAFIAMVAEVARDHLAMRPTAREMVNRANGFED